MGSYARILRVRHMPSLLATALVARLPIGINSLAIILLLREERGSFGIAGLAAGALALGNGLGTPLMARLVDRVGPGVLAAQGTITAAGLLGLVATAASAPSAVIVALAALTGLAAPPVSSVQRALYPRLLRGRPELIRGAFALDSVVNELIFVMGPALTAAIAAAVSPGAALVVSAAAVSLGTLAFLVVLRGGDHVAPPATRAQGMLGALRAPGVRTLVVTMLPVGLAFGILEITIAAFAADEARPELAGVLLTLWAVASAAGGLVYGARPRRSTPSEAHLRIALLLPVGLAPLTLATSPEVMALLLLPAGIFIAPLLATRNELAGLVAPEGSETEAYTWPLTAIVAGIAAGAAIAGVIVDEAGWRTAAVTAVGCAAVGSALAIARRATLHPAPEPACSPAGTG
jgi:MFS family permease